MRERQREKTIGCVQDICEGLGAGKFQDGDINCIGEEKVKGNQKKVEEEK